MDAWLHAPHFAVAFWQMKTSPKQSESNMEIHKKAGKMLIARNMKDLDADETLILWRPDILPKTPAALSLTSAKPAKRMRKQ